MMEVVVARAAAVKGRSEGIAVVIRMEKEAAAEVAVAAVAVEMVILRGHCRLRTEN